MPAVVGQQPVAGLPGAPAMAAPMSPRRAPGTAAAIPRASAASVASIRAVSASSPSPTVKLTAASPHQPWKKAPQSMPTRSPSARTVSSGMPWTTASLTLAQMTPGNGDDAHRGW